jgi:hypothetical protein
VDAVLDAGALGGNPPTGRGLPAQARLGAAVRAGQCTTTDAGSLIETRAAALRPLRTVTCKAPLPGLARYRLTERALTTRAVVSPAMIAGHPRPFQTVRTALARASIFARIALKGKTLRQVDERSVRGADRRESPST